MRTHFLSRAGLITALLLAPAGIVAAQEPDPLAPLPATSRAVEPAEQSALPRPPRQDRLGYAFDHPEILVRQRLIGLAHGLRLLGRVCLLETAFSAQTEQAYSDWYRRQSDVIDDMTTRLEHWYFEGRAPEPDAQLRLRDVVRALGLRSDLREMSTAERDAACASFPQAIASERYDFTSVLRALPDESAATAVAAPVEPAPPAAERGPVPKGDAVTSTGHLRPIGLPVPPGLTSGQSESTKSGMSTQ